MANGRAPSWTTITSASAGTAASPNRTDWLRVSPPATSCRRADPVGGDHDDDAVDRGPRHGDRTVEHGALAEGLELLRPAEAPA